MTLIVRAGGFAESTKRFTAAERTDGRICRVARPALLETRHRHADADRAAPRRRARERQRAQQRGNQTVPGCGSRRRAAADADVQSVPPDEQPVVASDGAGRVAARDRSERRQPHARAARRRAVQRSVRRLGVLDARAARERRPHRGRRRIQLQPVRQLRDGRRHQHRDRPARRGGRWSSSRSTAT